MAVKKKKPGKAPRGAELPDRHLDALHHVSAFLEKSRLADYMDLVQKPHKMAWLNFWAGVWRGFGIAVGGLVLIAVMVWGLKHAVHHLGGLPWIGDQVEQAVDWLLKVIEKRQAG